VTYAGLVTAAGVGLPAVVVQAPALEVEHPHAVVRAFGVGLEQTVPLAAVRAAKFVARLDVSLLHAPIMRGGVDSKGHTSLHFRLTDISVTEQTMLNAFSAPR
jgi:hypothetical protein